MSTGKHLHWELHKGKQHIWSATGAGYIEPVKFFKRLIEWEKSIATAPVEAKPGDPIIPTPTHDEAGSEAAEASENAIASAPTPAAPAAAPKPAAKAPARRR
jgi:murein DD-endopeptidase MepM/ murein hydrolase activator NlpD